MAAACAIDRIGLTIAPLAVLIVAICGGGGQCSPPPAAARCATGETLAFTPRSPGGGVSRICCGWRGQAFPPIGGGPDLAHHLVLVDYIERHWRLVHDPALGAVMGEMADYTPGVHLLAALAALDADRRAAHDLSDPRHQRRIESRARVRDHGARPATVVARSRAGSPCAAAVPLRAARGSLRSFTEHSFLAQVVSELFAVAMWWALVAWDERPSMAATVKRLRNRRRRRVSHLAGVDWSAAAGAGRDDALRGDLAVRERLTAMLTAGAPIAVVAAVHAVGRARGRHHRDERLSSLLAVDRA